MAVIPQRAPSAYVIALRISRKPVLLVEGESDKQFFRRFLLEAHRTGNLPLQLDDIVIDAAESLASPAAGTMSNRGKVEEVCRLWSGTSEKLDFVGFVDREFRNLDLSRITDTVSGHFTDGALIWTYGHSIENYFFESDTFRSLIEAVAPTDSFLAALGVFEMHFEEFIRFAAAASLAGKSVGYLQVLVDSFDGAIIVTSSSAWLDLDIWQGSLLLKTSGVAMVASLVASHYNLWIGTITGVDSASLRWYCHGHIGVSFLWSAYLACLELVGADSIELSRVRKISKNTPISSLGDVWVRRVFSARLECPRPVLLQLARAVP